MVSDDGVHGLTIIAFVGSVFSPAYARARRNAGPAGADPFAHCALNICLYGPEHAWAFTEFAAPAESPGRAADHWELGQSSLSWEDGALVVRFDERTAPFGRPLRGEVRLRPEAGLPSPVDLDPHGRHHWWPAAARSRASVQLSQPELSFEGAGYHDSNWGEEPLEAGFSRWTWCRANTAEGVAMLYDTVPRDGPPVDRGFLVDAAGEVQALSPARRVSLSGTRWRVFRETRSDTDAAVRQTYEDTPFYNRSLVETTLAGERVLAVHEALDLDRFTSGWVQFLLPFRIRHEGPRP